MHKTGAWRNLVVLEGLIFVDEAYILQLLVEVGISLG